MAPFLPKLQGYFAEFLSRGSLERLGMLYRTTCVGLRYGLPEDMLRSFSRKSGYARRRRRSAPLLSGSPSPADLPAENIATPFSVLLRQARRAFTLSSLLRSPGRSRNINRIPFGAPFRVVLRPRLTPVRLTLTGKPWSCGVGVSRTHYRYLCLHLLFRALQRSLEGRLQRRAECSPTPPCGRHCFGSMLDTRLLSTPGRSTSELLRTL